MDLPKNEYTFQFNERGERTKKIYDGSFTVRCLLTMEDIRRVGIKLDILNGGSQTLPPGVGLLNRAFAELDIRIIKAPSWWKDANDGRDMFDTNVILEVFNKALDAERNWDERVTEAAGEAEKQTTVTKKKKQDGQKE